MQGQPDDRLHLVIKASDMAFIGPDIRSDIAKSTEKTLDRFATFKPLAA